MAEALIRPGGETLAATHSWRVRYRRLTSNGFGTISGFPDAKTAEQYAQDM